MFRFSTSGFTDMYCAAVSTTKTSRDAALTAQSLANGTPTRIDFMVAKMTADNLYKLIGQYRNKKMPIDTVFFMVIDRTKAQFRFECSATMILSG